MSFKAKLEAVRAGEADAQYPYSRFRCPQCSRPLARVEGEPFHAICDSDKTLCDYVELQDQVNALIQELRDMARTDPVAAKAKRVALGRFAPIPEED